MFYTSENRAEFIGIGNLRLCLSQLIFNLKVTFKLMLKIITYKIKNEVVFKFYFLA